VTEGDLGERRASAWVVDDLLHDAADVAMALGVVEGAELGGSLVETRMGRCKGVLSISKSNSIFLPLLFRFLERFNSTAWGYFLHVLKIDPRPFL
jgi:uncharacterized membrane protein